LGKYTTEKARKPMAYIIVGTENDNN
jgi:hypothetical protein